ncbi:fumarylacetoacetate hydrolase family protein [Halalkalicoccus jeotgali]|uniref:Fumarylacetoacetate (FAA) hydrolase n=1 Tax=Halalkalicoccus jeotgali (strain DSM 18796 / CECT 7217 / JCM 14584 / KCTC 4019 / B3) TaxID=795797 RepID=D8J3Q7_HALJB|nr:fumarylacetoacetate hydrolase family protein [Halalkalicoccus jeotgali]ADJ13398.1 fumarylacetoacetate (FAA) hydrolase [Halalkalicoccus jeotgali B3]ELY32770.1 fumarylacetoacetate (FAA) hydrolase [Halalkalicoccus jeotgali B3]
MKYLARTAAGRPLLGDEAGFVPLSAAGFESVADALPAAAAGELPAPGDLPVGRIPDEGIAFGPPIALESLGKCWGIGLNYEEHAGDLDEDRPEEPASFMKPRTAVTGPGGPVRLPPSERTDRITAEAELGLVLGRTGSDLTEPDEAIAGYLPVIDMTAEDVLERNPRFLTRAKSFDTFLVLGPAIAVPDSPPAFDDRRVATERNGEVVAENRMENMLFSPRDLVTFHSRVMTLEAGDLISTGTPGAGVISAGDSVRAEVEGIGSVEADVV